MSNFWFILYLLVTLWALASIIFYGSRPTKSLAWVLAILALPLAGPILYYFFGVNRRKFKFFALRQTLKRKLFDQTAYKDDIGDVEQLFSSEKSRKLSCLIKNNTFLNPYEGNEVTLLKDGEKTFEVVFEELKKAKKFIHLQYYILEQGALFDRLLDLLQKKVEQGVEIRVIYDSFGSYGMRGKPKKRLKDIGVKIYPILPLRFGNLLYTLNYRNHRKIIVIDGEVGFTGGVNVSDKYIDPEVPLGKWDDLHVMLKGPVVNSLHRIFIKDYYFASSEGGLLDERYLPKIEPKGDSIVQIVSGGPDSEQPAIMQQYMAMVNVAEHSVVIANPYFIPGVAFLECLKMAALSGVKVKLIVPRKSDSLMAKYSMFAQFEELLKIGIDIYLRSDFSHSKVIIVDNEMASIGSGNFDHRSFEHNYETNALIYDKNIATELAQGFDKYCNIENKLVYESFASRPKWKKFLEGMAKFFSPLL
jgi:cardiolipin synthase